MNMTTSWRREPLANVCREITDGSHFSPKVNDSGHPYITVRDIQNDQIDFDNCKLIAERDYKELRRNGCKPNKGDILFSKDGTVGKVALVNFEKDFVVLSSLAIIRPDSRLMDSAFLMYAMKSPTFVDEAVGKKTGVAIRRIILRNLKSIQIPVPPLSEQKQTVQILDKALREIANVKATVETNLQNARALFDSQLHSVFAHHGKRWPSTALGSVCNFVRGPFGGSLKKSIFVTRGYAVYEQQHAIYDQFDQIRYFIDEAKFKEMKRFELRPGDLIMSCSGTMGRVAIAPPDIRPGIINQALLKLTPTARIASTFLKSWMESQAFQEALKAYSGGAAIQNVASVKTLKEIPVPLPPIAEQESIVEELTGLRRETVRLAALYERKLAALDSLERSVLDQAFTGQLTSRRVDEVLAAAA